MGVAVPIFEPHPYDFEKMYIFIEDKQIILASFFDISNDFIFPKNVKSCTVQIYSSPCILSAKIPPEGLILIGGIVHQFLKSLKHILLSRRRSKKTNYDGISPL